MDEELRRALAPTDRLTPWIGKVAVAGGLLEYSARSLHGRFVGAGRLEPLANKAPATSTFLRRIRAALPLWRVPADLLEAADSALAAALTANSRRHSVVHGLWRLQWVSVDHDGTLSTDHDRGGNWQVKWGGEQAAYEFSPEDLLAVVAELARADVRLINLHQVAHSLDYDYEVQPALHVRRLSAIQDDFQLVDLRKWVVGGHMYHYFDIPPEGELVIPLEQPQ